MCFLYIKKKKNLLVNFLCNIKKNGNLCRKNLRRIFRERLAARKKEVSRKIICARREN